MIEIKGTPKPITMTPMQPLKTVSNCSDDIPDEPWITGVHSIGSKKIPQISTQWSFRDHINAFRCRATNFRNDFTVKPGIYCVGTPDETSTVIVTANYRYTFDVVRKKLENQNLWIIVLDTKGVNVWCAAGKGTFGTVELIKRIKNSSLKDIVNHKKIIVPQLGAPGISAHEVQRATGFKVLYGPVRIEDLPRYIKDNFKATREMRIMNFTFYDRLVVAPMELNPAIKKVWKPFLGIIILMGLTNKGILFEPALQYGLPLGLSVIAGVLSGALLAPLMLPFLPFRSFALKGLFLGLIISAGLYYGTSLFQNYSILLIIASLMIVTGLSSYLSLQFTGTTTYTNMSGVEKEIRLSLPLYGVTLFSTVVLIIAERLIYWGIL